MGTASYVKPNNPPQIPCNPHSPDPGPGGNSGICTHNYCGSAHEIVTTSDRPMAVEVTLEPPVSVQRPTVLNKLGLSLRLHLGGIHPEILLSGRYGRFKPKTPLGVIKNSMKWGRTIFKLSAPELKFELPPQPANLIARSYSRYDDWIFV